MKITFINKVMKLFIALSIYRNNNINLMSLVVYGNIFQWKVTVILHSDLNSNAKS